MLLQSHQFKELPVISMRTGEQVTQVLEPIIDPFRLEICGFYTDYEEASILLLRSAREVGHKQIVIDDLDALSTPDELPRLEEVLRLRYELHSKRVITQSKQRLGKVEEYIIDTLSHKIQKLHVHQPMWRNLQGSTLIIDRQQIISLDDKEVIVSDTAVKSTALATQQSTP